VPPMRSVISTSVAEGLKVPEVAEGLKVPDLTGSANDCACSTVRAIVVILGRLREVHWVPVYVTVIVPSMPSDS
jgi:hypothetical protein